MPGYFPRIKPKVCDGFDPTVQCAERNFQSRNGTFFWDERRQGYCSTRHPGPWGIPVLLDACVYCFELLPGAIARKRWEDKYVKPRPTHDVPPGMSVTDGSEGEE